MRLMEREDFRMKENKMSRRSFLKVGAFASAAGMLAAAPAAANAAAPNAANAAEEENGLLGVFGGKPKYVFLFIGDGMGPAQIQSARFYKGTVENNGAVVEGELSFTQFPEVGSVTTYDSTSFCPDSASTATSIATGHKTESGVINMCPWTRDVPYETIAEKLHAQKNYKVGVVSSVNIDHATPAAFYAHQKTRKNYYDIGKELAVSGFEYFAGGEFQKVNGDGTGPNNHEIAAQNGYNVVTCQADAAALKAGAGKTLIIAEALADGKSMNYAMDAAAGEWQLTDYVRKGIELLDNKKGFFLMTESGKIDWACHANDAAASIHDVLEMSNAVQAAVDFYNAHPNETLILVTADHETGGMAIGYKTTNYDTFLTNLTHQKMSYAKFDSTYVEGYIANKTPFEAAGCKVENGKVVSNPEGGMDTANYAIEREALIPADGKGDHPSFMILTEASKALEKIGVHLIVTDLSDSTQLWDTIEADQADMWAAAWSATPDPDMYQIYFSGMDGKAAGGSNYMYDINDAELNQLILDARNSLDQSYRKTLYKSCLDIIVDWAVEVPVYQRQNAIIFSTQRVNMNTVTPDITTFYGWMSEIQNMELK